MIFYKNQEQVIIEIKKLMLTQHITQRELAARLGLSPQALNKLLNKKNFCFEDAERIANALGYQLAFEFPESTNSEDIEP